MPTWSTLQFSVADKSLSPSPNGSTYPPRQFDIFSESLPRQAVCAYRGGASSLLNQSAINLIDLRNFNLEPGLRAVFVPSLRLSHGLSPVTMNTSPSSSPAPITARSSSVKDAKHMDFLMPQVRDVPQFSSAAFGNTVFQIGTPPRRDQADRLVPSGLFGFGKQSSLPEIVQAGDPVLHEPAGEVPLKDIGSPEVEKIINDMVAVMRTAPGVGLAAPQIGVPLQIIVLEDTQVLMSYSTPEEVEEQQRQAFELLVLINPKLRPVGDATAVFFEGCLSVEGYRGLVERHLEVEVSALNRAGKPITVRARGWQARILQHECDHLQGTLYVDNMIPRTFRTTKNLQMPLASGCPKPGVCADFEMEMN